MSTVVCVVERCHTFVDPVTDPEETVEWMVLGEWTRLGRPSVRGWVVVSVRQVRLGMVIEATLPGTVCSFFPIMKRIRLIGEPPHVEAGRLDRGRVLSDIECQFEDARADLVRTKPPVSHERVCRRSPTERFECWNIERATG
jgi:hypothetical protein